MFFAVHSENRIFLAYFENGVPDEQRAQNFTLSVLVFNFFFAIHGA